MKNQKRAREKPHQETSRKRGKRERSHLLLPLHPPLQVPQTLNTQVTEEEQQPRRFVITSKDKEYNWSLSKEMA